ncbi:MAG: hypothetical protein LUC48_04040 [Clostridiales bacterium]|nr:hypothetical protein [Clostridiales bacterium]
MKHEKLLDAIGQVDGDLVQEAENVKTLAVPRSSNHWKRWTALAAVAVLAVGLFWARAWMDSVTGSDFATAEDAATEEAAEEEAAGEETVDAQEGGFSGQASLLWPPLLSVQGSDGQLVTVAGETIETEDALTGAEEDSGADTASAESAADSDGVTSNDSAEDEVELFIVRYDPTLRTLVLTFDGEAPASVTAVCAAEDGGEEIALTVTDGVLTLPDGEGWLVTVTAQWADGETCVYAFWADPDGGA